jgi:hypothetical protein
VKQLSGAPFKGSPLALPTNIRLGWKGLPGTNTLAYYENWQITAVKSFIGLAQAYFWQSANEAKRFYKIDTRSQSYSILIPSEIYHYLLTDKSHLLNILSEQYLD